MTDQKQPRPRGDLGELRPRALDWVMLSGLAVLLAGAVGEFYAIAAGTGNWYADFSLRWISALTLFILLCLAGLLLASVAPWRTSLMRRMVGLRVRLGGLRNVAAVILICLPILVLQYSPWGIVIGGPFLRLLLWGMSTGSAAWLLCGDGASFLTSRSLLGSLLLSGAAIVAAAAFTYVTDYPFSLGWSEGNRLWDYSLLFGKSLYRLKPGTSAVAYLDLGRQLIGGLPFLFSNVSIRLVRSWLAMVETVPYLLVGVAAFFPRNRTATSSWAAASLFALIFLSQGPIHPPLVVSTILVLLGWRLPVRWGAGLMLIAGYLAEASRFTWMFAPAMWIVMLELGVSTPADGKLPREAWRRAIALGGAGLLGSALAWSGIVKLAATSVASDAAVSTSQALLWYRLLPNATYGDGILMGLIKAAGPLMAATALVWIIYGHRSRLQTLVVCSCLLAFLMVGLVVSTKIGGGGDLHNMDMFLVGLFLTAALLWHVTRPAWLDLQGTGPRWIRSSAMLALVLPAFGALMSLHPISFASDAEWISVLVGAERPRDLGSLPDQRTIETSLEQIRAAVAETAAPVLFMDQRQLLTFGYLQGVELVPDYEKKRAMDEALSGNAAYFAAFYQDLADRRFGLIVSSPLRTPIKDSQYGFGEENNAWVNWVARPVLCYYEELDTLNEVKVELLIPREGRPACESVLPGRMP